VAPTSEILGGQAVAAARLIDGLRRDGLDAELVPINPQFPRGLRWLKRVRYVRTVVNEANFVRSLARLAEADVVHVFSASYWAFLLAAAPAMLAGRARGKRVVLHYHSGEAEDHLGHWGPLVHPWLRLAHEIVVPSQYLRRVFADHGYSTRVIHNTVDISPLAYRPRSPIKPNLLSVRNLERHYGVDAILRAFALLRETVPHATLTVVGEGSQARNLRRLADELAIDVTFAGAVDPKDMPAIYDAADIFVNASLVDNQPLSILEAFAAGLPVVTTAVGDIPAMVRDGVTGWVVPQHDPVLIADAIEDVLSDSERAVDVSRRALSRLSDFSWPAVRHAWQEAYATPICVPPAWSAQTGTWS
jgi:glycosyltransferase involved in cell wall biosynthesis